MTQPAPALYDAGNPLLAQVQARLDTGTIETTAGTVGILTVRTPSTTLTVLLSAADLRSWADLVSGLADQVGGGTVVAATPLDIAALKNLRGNGRLG